MAQYAVIGDPVEHSLSPLLFQFFAEQSRCSLEYQAICIKPWDLSFALARLKAQGYRGLNVTAPLKEKAYLLAHNKSLRAQRTEAVNIISFGEDGTYYGDNSDGLGFIRDLSARQKCLVQDKSVLILGAGGAARAVLSALLDEKPAQVVIANRSECKAKDLAGCYQKKNYPVFSVPWHEIALAAYDVVIQATAAGLKGESLQLPSGILKQEACCYDLVYGKGHLPFLDWSKAQGAAACFDGLGMLVEQAAETFFHWHHERVDTEAALQWLRTQI